MKTLVAGIVLILVLGIGGFLYRNVVERTENPMQTACTDEAKVCPDGTAVGRSGPACAFAACAAPNVEFTDVHIAFALPEGYAESAKPSDADVLGSYQKAATVDAFHHITVSRYTIPTGKTANDVIMMNTTFSPSDMQATSMDKFTPLFVNDRTFQGVVIERFEGQVESSYFLARSSDVLRFDILEKDVTAWTDPALVVEDLPQHKALLQMLSTLQTP